MKLCVNKATNQSAGNPGIAQKPTALIILFGLLLGAGDFALWRLMRTVYRDKPCHVDPCAAPNDTPPGAVQVESKLKILSLKYAEMLDGKF
jgi:hypothetical protein